MRFSDHNAIKLDVNYRKKKKLIKMKTQQNKTKQNKIKKK